MVMQTFAPTPVKPIESNVQWLTPSPLWSGANPRQPFIARFETDQFMDEFAALFANPQDRTQRLQTHQANARSYRRLLPGEPSVPVPTALKLYQPVHGHFYLITAALVCQQLGLPDRVINPGAQERAVFVLRRMVKLADGDHEQAWVDVNGVKAWVDRPTDRCRQLAQGEVTYPLFPTNYREKDGRQRRVLAGLIPTSTRETATATAISANDPLFANGEIIDKVTIDPRMTEFETRLCLPAEALLGATVAAAASSALQAQYDATFFWLLDLAELLALHHASVWTEVNSSSEPTTPSAIYTWLKTNQVQGVTVLTMLKAAWAERTKLYDGQPITLTYNFAKQSLPINQLESLWKTALPTIQPPPPAALSIEQQVTRAAPKIDALSTYVIRCVYQRPLCGCLQPDIVSEASPEFRIAPFFDPDAPARPIRITMPADTSIAGLRKYTRSVGIEMSMELRRQISRVADAKKALDGELGNELTLDLGVICSFSIPIITIVAIMLLMIIVILLNLVFWWLPFFRICFPIKR